jgi:hypothetical protein
MSEDEWTLIDEAASIIGEPRIQRAWRDPSFSFRGVPHAVPRTREPIEISFADRRGLVLDCHRKRAGRPRLWDYELVDMRTADIVQLAQADFERQSREAAGKRVAAQRQAQAESPDEAAAVAVPQGADGNLATLPLITGTSKAAAIARWLRHIYPAGRPGKGLDEMERDVRLAASKGPGKKLGVFSRSTFKRAVRLAWPPA